MNNLTLYNITNSIPAIMECEEITEEQRKELIEEITLELQRKSGSIIGYIKNIDLTIEAMKSEEKRISEQRKALEKRLDHFKEYVKDCLNNNGITKVETGLGTISVAKSPISVEVTNEAIVPDIYKTVKTTISIDKKAIADNFKTTGELIDGVEIHSNNYNLRIK